MELSFRELPKFKEMGLSLFRLKFKDNILNKEFIEDYYNKSINQVRISFFLAIFLYAFLGLLDFQIMKDYTYLTWFIRFSGVLPIAMLVLVSSFSDYFKKYNSLAISFAMLTFGFGILVMIYIAPKPVDFAYYSSMIITFIFIYILTGLRFTNALLVSLLLFISYEILAIFMLDTPEDLLIKNTFFFAATNLVGMFGAYFLEYFARRDFYVAKFIDSQREELLIFNRELKNKVEAQTKELLAEIDSRKENEIELIASKKQLENLYLGTVTVLGAAVELRDPFTSGHQERVSRLSVAIAKKINMDKDEIEGLRLASKIHDIGKLVVPAMLLNKPTELTYDEKIILHKHAQAGFELLKEIDFPWPIAEIVYQHHEYIDGTGYPNNLKGNEILLSAKIMCVADVFEAITCDRSYRPSYGVDYAISVLQEGRSTLYEANIVDTCIALIKDDGFDINSIS